MRLPRCRRRRARGRKGGAAVAAAIERLSSETNVSIKQFASDLGCASTSASRVLSQLTGMTPSDFAQNS
jgi:methylphosphotriester-DNA--protein-cysteine methyltransferase